LKTRTHGKKKSHCEEMEAGTSDEKKEPGRRAQDLSRKKKGGLSSVGKKESHEFTPEGLGGKKKKKKRFFVERIPRRGKKKKGVEGPAR